MAISKFCIKTSHCRRIMYIFCLLAMVVVLSSMTLCSSHSVGLNISGKNIIDCSDDNLQSVMPNIRDFNRVFHLYEKAYLKAKKQLNSNRLPIVESSSDVMENILESFKQQLEEDHSAVQMIFQGLRAKVAKDSCDKEAIDNLNRLIVELNSKTANLQFMSQTINNIDFEIKGVDAKVVEVKIILNHIRELLYSRPLQEIPIREILFDPLTQLSNNIDSLRKDVHSIKLDPNKYSVAVLYFESKISKLTPKQETSISMLENIFKDAKEKYIICAGHADDQPISIGNHQLSDQRAESVGQFIRQMGIDVKRIKKVAHAENYPIESNETFSGRQLNRRVQVFLVPPNILSSWPYNPLDIQ